MADKLNDLAGKMGKAPKGLGLGVKLLAAGAAAAYGLNQSMYTVDGGHRAIIFNRCTQANAINIVYDLTASPGLVAFRTTTCPRVSISACLGSSIPSCMTSEPGLARSPHQLAPRISRWSTSLSGFSQGNQNSRKSTNQKHWTTSAVL